jgi:hypothetical protein
VNLAPNTISRKPTMLTWQGRSAPRLESVRLLTSDNRLRASGRLIAATDGDDEPFSTSFEAATDESGAVSRLLIRATSAEDECQISVNRTEDGVWLVDRGEGTERSSFGGALDIDVAGAVLFNSIPIRRLALHREEGTHELPVVHVSLPRLTVRVVRQTYTTVSIGDASSVINYSEDGFSADITVDRDGFVLEYPDLAHRV